MRMAPQGRHSVPALSSVPSSPAPVLSHTSHGGTHHTAFTSQQRTTAGSRAANSTRSLSPDSTPSHARYSSARPSVHRMRLSQMRVPRATRRSLSLSLSLSLLPQRRGARRHLVSKPAGRHHHGQFHFVVGKGEGGRPYRPAVNPSRARPLYLRPSGLFLMKSSSQAEVTDLGRSRGSPRARSQKSCASTPYARPTPKSTV